MPQMRIGPVKIHNYEWQQDALKKQIALTISKMEELLIKAPNLAFEPQVERTKLFRQAEETGYKILAISWHEEWHYLDQPLPKYVWENSSTSQDYPFMLIEWET